MYVYILHSSLSKYAPSFFFLFGDLVARATVCGNDPPKLCIVRRGRKGAIPQVSPDIVTTVVSDRYQAPTVSRQRPPATAEHCHLEGMETLQRLKVKGQRMSSQGASAVDDADGSGDQQTPADGVLRSSGRVDHGGHQRCQQMLAAWWNSKA